MGMPNNLTKLTNKELVESAFKSIENEGFHITDVVFGNSYFLFGGENDSICHFHIREIPRISVCFLECK